MQKQNLMNGFWILAFHGKVCGAAADPEFELAVTHYLRVAFVSGGLKQFFPVVSTLKLLRTWGEHVCPGEDDAWAPEVLHLESQDEFLDYNELCFFLGADREWAIQVYELQANCHLDNGSFCASRITAVRAHTPPCIAWRGIEAYNASRRRPAGSKRPGSRSQAQTESDQPDTQLAEPSGQVSFENDADGDPNNDAVPDFDDGPNSGCDTDSMTGTECDLFEGLLGTQESLQEAGELDDRDCNQDEMDRKSGGLPEVPTEPSAGVPASIHPG